MDVQGICRHAMGFRHPTDTDGLPDGCKFWMRVIGLRIVKGLQCSSNQDWSCGRQE